MYIRWTIKARVTKKTDIKRWSNAKGEGTLFSIDLLGELFNTITNNSKYDQLIILIT